MRDMYERMKIGKGVKRTRGEKPGDDMGEKDTLK